ncbi:MAG: hypothetical protein RJA48_1216, partial [Verrucomicrobiota bacterium]
GDAGLMATLHAELTGADASALRTSLEVSIQSHRMAFAAETSRKEGRTVVIETSAG